MNAMCSISAPGNSVSHKISLVLHAHVKYQRLEGASDTTKSRLRTALKHRPPMTLGNTFERLGGFKIWMKFPVFHPFSYCGRAILETHS